MGYCKNYYTYYNIITSVFTWRHSLTYFFKTFTLITFLFDFICSFIEIFLFPWLSIKTIEKSKEIVKELCTKLQEHHKSHGDSAVKGSGIRIPYDFILSSSLPSKESWSMTVLTRLLNYIGIITRVNIDSMPRIVDTETSVFYPI